MSQPCPSCPGLFNFREVCMGCGRQPAAIVLTGEIGADCFPAFRKAMDFISALQPCLRLYVHLGKVVKVDGLLPILILEFITRHRELRPILTGIPAHLKEIIAEIHRQLSEWISVTDTPFPFHGPKDAVPPKLLASFKKKRSKVPWEIEIFLVEAV